MLPSKYCYYSKKALIINILSKELNYRCAWDLKTWL